MTLYIPVKGQTELKKLSIPNNTEDAVYELADKRDYGYLKENIYNEKVENIGARRLHTILEKLLEDISFNIPDMDEEKITIDQQYVKEKFAEKIHPDDIDKYIL